MMAESPLAEIFSNVTLFVDPERFAEPRTGLPKNDVKTDKKGLHFEIRGTFEDIEATFLELHGTCKEREKSQSGAPAERSSAYERISDSMISASGAPVEVESVVMDYIKKICSADLRKIVRPEVRMKAIKKQVSFHPRDPRHGTLLAHLARERFITFYQKIATELQTRSYCLDAHQLQPLFAKYPELLLSTEPEEADQITLTGRFISLERFEQFFKNPTKQCSRQIGYTEDMGAAASSRDKIGANDETCSICLEQMVNSQMKTLEKCRHSFCSECLKKAFEMKPVCPVCGVLYGALKGTQPKDGKMEITYEKTPLPGYGNYRTIIIQYVIPSGLQGDEHPNPGHPYEGAARFAYLPDSTEGQIVLKLLQQAFKQRLIFTVGRSSTTGRSNVVTWNDIHHKTSRSGGPTTYGYPDPDYLKRVQEELKVKGIY